MLIWVISAAAGGVGLVVGVLIGMLLVRRAGRSAVVPQATLEAGSAQVAHEDDDGEDGCGRVVAFSGPIVSARNLHRSYRTSEVTVPALRGIDIDIGRGEFVAVVGPSGNGKSTLLNCLSGIDAIDDGQVLVDGQDLQALSHRQRAAHRADRMGFVFQSFNLIHVLSAEENVELPLLAAGVKPLLARQRAAALLERVGLSARLRHRPGELSGGEQQRVAVARALVTEPAVIWADEPTGNLDSASAGSVMGLFREVHDAGQTIVMVTHDAAVAAEADRVVEVRDGKIISDGVDEVDEAGGSAGKDLT